MKVLMIGAGRDVRGGVSSVVNSYYEAGLQHKVDLTYLPTMEDGSKLHKLWVAFKAYVKFGALLKDCDILHVHMSVDASFYRKAVFIRRAKKAGKKILIHMHGSTFDSFYLERCDEKQKANVRDIFAMADAVIALSDDWKNFIDKTLLGDGVVVTKSNLVTVIYNSVNIPKSYEKDYANQKMLFLGLLGQRKGTYDLIKVLPNIFRKYPDAHIYFGGDGEREKAEALCKECGIDTNVTFLGWVRGKDKEQYLKDCSMYVLPTYHEGMPMSVLEAMAYGLAVDSTYVGGIPHIITDGENGLLQEAGDLAALEKALDKLLSDENERRKLGENAAKRIRADFDINNNLEKLLQVYQTLV